MFKLDVKADGSTLAKKLSEHQRRHIPFALMLTQTRLAQRVKEGELQVMKARLDRPTPTTLKSLFMRAATKSKAAEVYFKDAWTSGIPADAYLQQAVQGGIRPHKRFEKALIAKGLMESGQYAVPTASFLNQYGNVSRGTMTRILSGLGAAEQRSGYQANASGSKRSQRKGNAKRYFTGSVSGEQGVWERGSKDKVKPVFTFTDGAPGYSVIFPFFTIAANIVKAHRGAEFTAALSHAINTARN